jgi:hypothetical protein
LEIPTNSVSPTSHQSVSVENHTVDLTKSLSSTNRPTIEGGSSVPAVVHPTPYLPHGGQQALSFGGYNGQQSFDKAPVVVKNMIKGSQGEL